MIKKFFPEKYVESVYQIDLEKLKSEKIEALIFDIDNTLVPYYVPNANKRIKKLFSAIKAKGIKVGVLSNNNKNRVSIFCKELNIEYVHKAGKPGVKGLGRLIKKLGVKNHRNTVIIGDQVFTDVLCGNRMGIHTILVKPVSKKDAFGTWLKRGIESIVINLYLKRKKISPAVEKVDSLAKNQRFFAN